MEPSIAEVARLRVPRTVAAAFAVNACEARAHALEESVAHAANRAVVDWFAAAIAGSAMPPAQLLAASLLRESVGASRLVPDGRLTGATVAALVNATAAHTAEIDDIYRDGAYHPGAPTIAAALALADRAGSSGIELFRAVATGYETGNRIATAVNPEHYRYWHTTGTIGTVGAAAAAAEILGLGVEQWTHAVATAVTLASGLQQAFRSDSMSKALHAGHAAQAGTTAALAAREGFTGAVDVLEGATGLGVAMAGSPNWEAAIDALEQSAPTILDTTVKAHACCGHAFAAIDAALEARATGMAAEEIDAIAVETYGAAVSVAGGTDPSTPFEAKFSIPYCVAAAFVTGSAQLATFEEPTLSRPDLRDLASRVEVRVDPALDARFPGMRAARLILQLRDGNTRIVERLTRKGDPDDPLSDEELSEKFQAVVGPLLGSARAERLETTLWRLAELDDVTKLALR